MVGTKVALVTGGGTGVGKASAMALSGLGYEVVLCGRRRALLDAVVDDAEGQGLVMKSVVADVSDPASVRRLFSVIEHTYARLDLLFNNAGVNLQANELEDISYEQWAGVLDTNLSGAFLCTQQAFRIMKAQRPQGGRIINNGSLSAYVPRPGAAPYASAKHGVTGLTRASALEGRSYKIACGQIDIGNAATVLSGTVVTGARQADGSLCAEPQIDVSCVAQAVAFMAGLPVEVNVLFLTVMATEMPFVGRG